MKIILTCVGWLMLTAGFSWSQTLPEPPRQHTVWHTDASIPTNILSAVETLFAQGFPDPRGCEYREIEVKVSGVWDGKSSLVKTHGWVLPEKSRETNRYAICWNGLIYPVANVSVPVDLHAEFTNAISPLNMRFGRGNNSAAGEEQTVLFSSALSTRVLLLLRRGETELALTNWMQNRRMMFFGGGGGWGPGAAELNDPYLEFAGDWAWAMFDRTICAHMRGDETLALATARQLADVQPKIEAECAKRGFHRQAYYDSVRHGKQKPYLDFLDQLPQLLSDLERREKEPKQKNVIEIGLPNFPDQTKRISALIKDLDVVSARQWSQPGGVNLPEDPIVSALIQEGDTAVEPLLDCLENDKRLTRSVGFGRDFFRGRSVIPVSSAASVALQTILQAGFTGGVPEMRAYWNKYKNLKLEERWYAILNDDFASSRWLEAASRIVQPENITTFPGGYSMTKPAPTNAPVRLRGESLRAKTNPSVTELLTRHALEVPTNNIGSYDLATCCRFAEYLAQWDPQAALPVAKILSKRASTVTKYSGQQLGNFITQLSLTRANDGDPQAFDDYSEWIVTTTPEQLGFSFSDNLEPFRRFPTNMVLQSTAEKIFGQTNSSWGQLPWSNGFRATVLDSGLVAIPAYRVLLCRELDKTNVCGSVSWQESGSLNYTVLTYHEGGSYQFKFPDGLRPTNGASSEIRWCDWVALSLSNGKHIPLFNPFAPVEKRDEAIEKAKILLEH